MKMSTFMKTENQQKIPNQSSIVVWIVNIGLILIAVAALLPILRLGENFYRWIYAVGAAACLGGRLATISAFKGFDLRVRRLARMEFWAAIMFAVATFFMFYKGAGPTDWLAFTLAGAALQTYTSIMLPRALAK